MTTPGADGPGPFARSCRRRWWAIPLFALLLAGLYALNVSDAPPRRVLEAAGAGLAANLILAFVGRRRRGAWLIQVPLNHGHHHYRFLVDGKPVLDPRAQGIARDHQGEKVSLLAVS